jgi:hypothetical protein
MSQIFFGVVEDRNDPMRLGRCRVRVFGVHDESTQLIPTTELPWAYPIQPITSAGISGIGHAPVGPVEGSWVAIMFIDADQQQPVMLGTVGGIPQDRGSVFMPDDEIAVMDSQTGKTETRGSTQTNTQGILTTSDGTPVKSGSGETWNTGTAPKVTNIKTAKLADLLSESNQNKLRVTLLKRESSNNYSAKNRYMYVGGYQFGAIALTDLGYVRKGTKNPQLLNDEVWLGKNGISKLDDWFAQSSVQDKACLAMFEKNFTYLKRMSAINESTSEEEMAGLLCAAHLVGAGGAANLTKGIIKKDGNGVTAKEYYDLGYLAVKGAKPDMLPTTEAEQFKTSSTDQVAQKQIQDSKYGFKDPTNRYPIADLIKEPDTNRLARAQSISKTIVANKDTERDTGVKIANSTETWDQPAIPYNAKYPFNHVYQSESGHLLEFDDTPNAERVHLYHSAGTYTEIDRNGTQVNRIMGDGYTIYERHGNIHIAGTCNITIEGNANLYVMNDLQAQVDGNVHFVGKNDVKMEISGDLDISVKESVQIRCADFKVETTAGDLDLYATGSLHEQAGGTVDTKAGGNINHDGAQVHLNSGTSSSAQITSLIDPIKRATPVLTPFITLESVQRDMESMAVYETPDEGDSGSYNDDRVASGEVTAEEIKVPTVTETQIDKTTSTGGKSPQIIDCIQLKGMAEIPMSLQLTKNFTVAWFCQDGSRKLRNQAGLTVGDIACNMKNLATNCAEPIKAKYPDMYTTSGFRYVGEPANSSATSQHNTGMAMDIQFRGISVGEYFNRAVELKNLISYDQLILEYATKNGAVTAWIHVSFNPNGNRRMIFTMKDHKRVGDMGKLIQLG